MKKLVTLWLLICGAQLSAQTVTCDFQQTKFIAASGKTVQSNGSLTFDYAGKLDMRYNQPQGDFFIIDGKTISMNINGKKATIDTEKNPRMKSYRNTLVNCITGNWDLVCKENDAESTVIEKNGMKIVEINAKKISTRGYSKITLSYRKSDNMLVEMVLEEFNGIVTTYRMSNCKKTGKK